VKIGTDENVSPAIAKAVAQLDIHNEVIHLPAIYHLGTQDIPLSSAFAADGGYLLVGGDYNMTSRPHELLHIHSTGLRLYILPSRWNTMKRYWKAGFLVRWWGNIVEHALEAEAGSAWHVPAHWEKWEPAPVRLPTASMPTRPTRPKRKS
jgi:hypothetical protein